MRSLPLSPGRGILTLCLVAIMLMFFVPLVFGASNLEFATSCDGGVDGDPDDYGSPQPSAGLLAYVAWFLIVLRYAWWRMMG